MTLARLDPGELDPVIGAHLTEPGVAGYTIESWLSQVERLGPVFRTELYGAECVVIADAAANKQAWKVPDNWSYRDTDAGVFFRRQMGEDHVSALDGEPHRRLRKLILPAFGASALQRDIGTTAEVLDASLANLCGEPIDFYAELCRMFSRALTRTQIKSFADEITIEMLCRFEEAFILGQQLSLDEQEVWFGREEYRSLRADAFDYFNSTLHARQQGGAIDDSLGMLLARPVPDGMAPLTDSELAEAVYLLSVAGVGNIANLLCPLCWMLMDSEWRGRLSAEVEAFEPGRLTGMKQYPVLAALILEAERCFPPAPVVPKRVVADVEILGETIPAGTLVMHLHTLWQFDEANFADARSFRPERWLDRQGQKPNAFGGGKHLCLGMGVTRVYLPLTLALLYGSYDLQLDSPPAQVPLDPLFEPSPRTTRCEGLLTRL